MTRSVGRSCCPRWWFVACCALTAIGCSPELEPPNATNARIAGLPSDSASYVARVAQFRAAQFQPRKRKAKCFLSLCKRFDVEIAALGTPSQIDPENGPEEPVAVASLHNPDTEKTEKYYGIEPGGRYELWVGRKSSSDHRTVWQLVGLAPHGLVVAGELRDLTYCHKPPFTHALHADFAEYVDGKCTAPKAEVTKAGLSFSVTTLFSGLLSAMFGDDRRAGGWIDCSNGCCT